VPDPAKRRSRVSSARTPHIGTLPAHSTPAAGSLVADAEHWLSSAAVRQALGAWAYTRAAGEARPNSADVRSALGVASAIVERAMRSPWGNATGGVEPTWRIAVPEDLGDLRARTGLAMREVSAALELLAAAGVIVRQSGSEASLRVSDDVMAPAPATAQLDWNACRDRLARVGGSLPPALATLREVAYAASTIANPGQTSSVRASVRDLEDQTAFGRSTVAEALGALEHAGLLEVAVRAGRTTRFTLRPAAFGLPQPDDTSARGLRPVAPIAAKNPDPSAVIGGAGELRSSAREGQGAMPLAVTTSGKSASPVLASGTVLLGEFAGTPIFAPLGTALVVERDSEGRWTCRVGPFLSLGPVQQPE